ncbi:MAG: endonuclease MutS2 [Oscillospiraceae bacterium]|nr:endonuclease MutS2 [Oscillospiraceae bacterium]
MNKHHRTLELDKILALLAEHCACADARALALALAPESSLALAQALLFQTRDAHMLLARFGGPSFGGLENVSNALRRAQAGGVLSLRELLEIAQVLRVLRGIATWREGNAGVETCLDALFGGISPNRYLEDMINGAILSEDRVADHASPALAELRRKIRQQENNVRSRLEQLTRSPLYGKFLQENLVTMRGGRFVVPVKAEHRGEIAGLVHDSSASGATVFIEPMGVVEANNEIKLLQGKEREEIERILAAISAEVGSFFEPIQASYACAAELDLIFAKAKLGYDMKAAVPQLNGRGELFLQKARHPLISKDRVVPVDLELGLGFDALVITGPNTGGKTVSLKTAGLLCLMAMCGLMLPAGDQSRVPVFGQVLADIGDEQSIEQSLSTFSSHIKNIIEILSVADGRSLVLIDELGAGTDPVEGAALAMSLLEELRRKGAKLAATTHYAELKAYALETTGVENACCEFDVATLRPTYRLLIGVPGRSNAFAISQRLGMPEEVVTRARALASGEDLRFEHVIAQLEERLRQAELAKEETLALRSQAQAALSAAEQTKEAAARQMEKALEEVRAQGRRIVEQAKREAYALAGELDRLKKEKDTVKDVADLARRARAAVKKGVEAMEAASDPVRGQFVPAAGEAYTLPRALRTGDRVRLADLGIEGEVLSPPDAKALVEIQAGALRLRSKLEQVRLLGEAQGQTPHQTRRRTVPPPKSGEAADRISPASETRLDLRGQSADDCLLELDRFLDTALRSGLHEFTVIHGKGTGVLRKAVQGYLKSSPFVKSYRLGVYGEGETGVTIVELHQEQ